MAETRQAPDSLGTGRLTEALGFAAFKGCRAEAQPQELALACLKTLLRLVNDIGAAATTDHAVIPVAVLERLERVADLHDRLPVLN